MSKDFQKQIFSENLNKRSAKNVEAMHEYQGQNKGKTFGIGHDTR